MSILKRKPNINNPERSDSGWDREWKAEVLSSRRHAWIAAGVMAMLLGGSIADRAFMTPKLIKEVVPVMVNNQEGVYQALTRLDEGEVLKPSESLTKSDLARFVTARESYDYYYLVDRASQVRSMAVGSVAEKYNAEYFVPDAAYKTIKNDVTTLVDVTYVSPTGGETRSVQFSKTMISGGKETTTYHIATITFEYDNDVELKPRERMKNPLGMQIYYYEVETDLAAES